MTPNSNEHEAEIIYRIIRGELNLDSLSSSSDDAEFAAALRQNVQKIQADPIFQADLENRLRRISPKPQKSVPQIFSGVMKNLAWVAAVIAIIVIVSWSIRNLLPHPPVAATAPVVIMMTETPTATPTPESLTLSSTPGVEGTPLPGEYSSPLFLDNKILFKVEFPTSPTEAKVYVQNFDEALTLENGLAMAAQLGINGKIYNIEKTGQQLTNYTVTDGISRILFYSPHHFYYVPNYQKVMEASKQDTPTTDEQISIAESFLKEHGLLDFPYSIQTDDSIPGLVKFMQLLDGRSIHYGSTFIYPVITMEISSQGEIRSLNYDLLHFSEIGTYPIISAEEAWQKSLVNGAKGIEANSFSLSTETNESWLREYPVGQRLELFGYPEILQPAEAGDAPLIFINNYPIVGNQQELAQSLDPSQIMQVWGQFQADDKGNLFFQIEGWQPSPFQLQSLEGIIQRQDDQGYLLADDKQWIIPDLPDSIPEGLKVYVNGVKLENKNELEWSSITTVASGGGGGGGGGFGFFELNLDRLPTPVPVPTETPYPLPQIGERFDGLQGNPYVTFFKNADGSTQMKVNMNIKPTDKWPGGISLNLIGDGLAGIEAYHQLPVRIWGSITSIEQSIPTMTVERYEPVYPGMKSQAWLGTLESITLVDKPVLLFTDQSGSKYVLNTSLEAEAKTPPTDVPFIVEGVIYPDQTYANYPVMHDFLMLEAQGMENLVDYKPQSSNPITLDASPTDTTGQILTVENIELVYYADDMRFALPDNSMPLSYAQPVWRFYGHSNNGDLFEILVQALSDEYLQ
ncbi:MAG: hypothetical protein ABFD53_05095 [Anaerolineaceae bacterium]